MHGPWEPDEGHWCNPNKLLLDPYAKAIDGTWAWHESMFPYHFDDPDASRNDLDSAPHMPKSVVVDPAFDWEDDRPPRTPWHETIIYETHVKGFTMRNSQLPEHVRGAFGGLANPASVEYLQKLGVTAVELLPVHQFVQDSLLLDAGLRNYWGYNSIGYFAPHNEYATGTAGEQVQEFKGDGEGAAPRRHRGHPRRGLQPHGRGQPPRPDPVVQGHRQRRLLPPHGRRPAATTWTTPAPATRSTCATRTCCS